MKRGKEEEKVGPMFPRLHVNDTEKGGGPRAPPRNKMALYEQLSVPSSHRFHPSNLPPPPPSPQASAVGKNSPFPSSFSHSMPAKSPTTHFSRGSLSQLRKKRKLQEEDDFTVPVFVQSRADENHCKAANCSTRPGRATDCDPKVVRASALDTSPDKREQKKKQASTKDLDLDLDFSGSSSTSSPTAKENKASASNEVQNVNQMTRSEFSEVPLQQRPASGLLLSDDTGNSVSTGKLVKDSEKRKTTLPRGDSVSMEVYSKPENGSVCRIINTDASLQPENIDASALLQPENIDASALLQPENGDQCHDISKTSVLDSVSVFDVSPDDVVKIIGQKHFWKARRLIVNQQRVFAVQVFELHRLIKVQQLIAEYPDVLLEDNINKPSKKSLVGKKVSSDHDVMPTSDVVKCDENSQKSNQKIESSAENAVGKRTPMRKDCDIATPRLANSPQVLLPTDPKLHPSSFQHPLGHQWLVPVMSLTEGLVYKPYTVPGLMGSVCGGFGNLGAPHLSGQTMNQLYGFPAPHYHQHQHHHGAGVPPDTPHAYFPPHGLSATNGTNPGSPVEQRNHFTEHASNGQTSQSSFGGANFSLHQQSPRGMPSQKSAVIRQVAKVRASKDADLLGSTASSLNRGEEPCTERAAEGRNHNYPSPMLSAASEGAQRQDTGRPTHVIKVVPHNRRSANESAARIFQSIQEERKQYESM